MFGVDPTPQDLLWDVSTNLGTVVSQQIFGGLAGVMYLLTCEVVGDSGTVAKKISKLAILPSSALIPDIFATYLTSRPYPVEAIEGIASTSPQMPAGRSSIWYTSVEAVSSEVSIIEGILRSILVEYDIPPEGIDSTVDIVSGILDTILVTYDISPEGINSTVDISAGTLVNKFLIYDNWPPEGINSSVSIISGTLV